MFRFALKSAGPYTAAAGLPGAGERGETAAVAKETEVVVELLDVRTRRAVGVWSLAQLRARMPDIKEYHHAYGAPVVLADPFATHPSWFQVRFLCISGL